jgi:HAD superfamily hydrolase (TIGR01549 family)
VPVRAVLFDLDNTLYDHQFALRAAVAALRRSDARLRAVPFAELMARDQAALDTVHRDLVLTGRLGPDAARIERMRALYASVGAKIGRAEASRRARQRRAAYLASERAVPGAGPLLRRLRGEGIRVGVVTNNLVKEQVAKLRRTGLYRLVDVLTISEEVGATKPDPRIFQVALERLGAKAASTVMVGDSWEADILGGLTSGLGVVWLRRGPGRALKAPGPVSVLSSFLPVERALRTILTAVPRRKRSTSAAVPARRPG